MSEHPEGRSPHTGVAGEQPVVPDETDVALPAETATTSSETPESPESPEGSVQSVDREDAGSLEDDAGTGAEAPDALGEVEVQELLPEAESTIAAPGEALDALLPALEVTGHDGVDDALATLDDMAEKSVHEHVEVFDAVHEELRRTLDQAADR